MSPAQSRFPTPATYLLSEDNLQIADVRFVVDHPRIVTGVAELLGQEICLSAFVLYGKPPGTAGTPGDYQAPREAAHCDYKPYRPVGSSLRWLFVIIPLIDYTEEVGPLFVSPGSHRIPTLIRKGNVTHVQRAQATDIAPLVDTQLKRGQVAFMDMFTWHQGHSNRSNKFRCGVYNKYRAKNAPPGCGPYLFRHSSAELLNNGGVELLADYAAGRIAETCLLIEDGGRFLMLPTESGPCRAPGGAAQPHPKLVATDDDNVISQLIEHVGTQLNTKPPWVSYVDDYPLNNTRGNVCRVYACPRNSLPDVDLTGHRTVWLQPDELLRETGDAYLATAAQQWLNEPVLRGIGQSEEQAKKTVI